MYFKKTKLDGVFTHKLTKSIDFRGFVIENFQKKQISNFKLNFVQDTISFSNKNVLRGLHGDNSTWKLVSVIIGEAYIIVANNDKKSKMYRKWIALTVSKKNLYQILIPPKYALGYLALSKDILVSYKQTSYYGEYKQFTIKYNDKDFNFKWPNRKFKLSKRDQ